MLDNLTATWVSRNELECVRDVGCETFCHKGNLSQALIFMRETHGTDGWGVITETTRQAEPSILTSPHSFPLFSYHSFRQEL